MLPSQVSQYHYHQEIISATFSGCGFCTYSTVRSGKNAHGSQPSSQPFPPKCCTTVCVCCISYIQYCLWYCILNYHTILLIVLPTVFMWLVFGLCGMRRVGGEGRGSYSFSPSGAYRGGQSVRGEGRGVGARVLGNGVRPSDSM